MRHLLTIPRPAIPSPPSVPDHLRWAVPLTLAVVSGAVAYHLMDLSVREGGHDAALALSPLIPIILGGYLLIRGGVNAWVCAHRLWRTRRFRAGHRNKVEARALAVMEGRHRTVDQAQAVIRDLAGPRSMDLGHPWGINLPRDERVLFHGPSTYSRYYGTTVSYTRTTGLFMGSPLFVASGLLLTAAGNRASRSAAVRQAAEQWRETQSTEFLITDRRVLVHRLDGMWLSFHFDQTVAFFPHLEAETLFMEFSSTEPLRIHGPASAIASAVAVWHAHGVEGLLRDPGLSPLRIPSSAS